MLRLLHRTNISVSIVGIILIAQIISSCKPTDNGESEISNPNGRNDNWGYVGPGGGGAMFYPTVSPHNPDHAFVSCDMTGSYVTRNGGETWRMFNLRGVTRFYVFDPNDSNVVYARSSALFRSTDGGDTWNLLYPHPSEIVDIVSKGDHAHEIMVTKDNIPITVLALAVDPDNSKKLYAAIEIGSEISFFTSNDWGENWTKKLILSDGSKDIFGDSSSPTNNRKVSVTGERSIGAKDIFVDPSSPTNNRKIFVTGDNSILVINGNESEVNDLPDGINKVISYAGGFSSDKNSYIIYAISGKSYFDPDGLTSGIFMTSDDGKTWVNKEDGLASMRMEGTEVPEWRAIATCQTQPNMIYVSYDNLKVHNDTICIGVAISEDYGDTWKLSWKDKVNQPGAIPAENMKDAWINERFGPGWGENPFSIGVAPNNPNICYTTDFGRTIKTMDGGRTWEQVYTKKKNNGGWMSTGLQVTTNYMLAFDPFDSTHILMANTDTGLMQSKDGGESWSSATNNNGVPRPWYNSTYWLAFDPVVQNRVWAVMSRNHDLPRPKMWRRLRVDQFMGGVLVSDDGGANWKPVSQDIGEAAMTHILIDPESDPSNRTIYACAFGKGVFKSFDGGKSWVQKNQGIEGDEPFAWRITRRNSDGTLFLVVSRRSNDGSIGNEGDGALYISTNGAESWTKVILPEGTNGPTSLLVDSEKSGRILLSAWGRPIDNPVAADVGGGIFISENDGYSWIQVLEKDQHIHDITMDSRNGIYYACGFNASAYMSEDKGASWERIKGYNFKWGKRVEPDLRDPEKIYIITFGGGVWHGPAAGDHKAQEDIVTPVLAYDK